MQVLEFVHFKDRLEQSHSRAVARAEAAVYRVQSAVSDAITKGNLANAQLAAHEVASDLQQSPDARSQAAATAMRFNADLSTLPVWLPPFCGSHGAASADWWFYHSAAPQQGAVFVFRIAIYSAYS